MGLAPSVEDQMFELRMSQRQFDRLSTRSKRLQQDYEYRCKKAYAAGDKEMATLHAQGAVQQKRQSQTYSQMSQRLNYVYDRLAESERMFDITDQLGKVVNCLHMNESTATEMLNSLNTLTLQFDRSDVVQELMVDSGQCIEPLEVTQLLQRVDEEVGHEQSLSLARLPVPNPVSTLPASTAMQLSQTSRSRS